MAAAFQRVAADMETCADSESRLIAGKPREVAAAPPRRFGAIAKAAAAVGSVAALLLAGAAIHSGVARPMGPAAVAGSAVTELEQIVAENPTPMCSKPYFGVMAAKYSAAEANCVWTKCCKITGQQCFQKKPGYAACMKPADCDAKMQASGWDCTQPHDIVPLVEVKDRPNTKLYCFSVYTHTTGSTKISYELDLFRMQHEHSWSIFSCSAGWDVFSDVSASIGTYTTIKVDDVNNEFHSIKRKTTGTWVNTGLFKQAWKAIAAKGTWASADWVVKADADAVFLPERLVLKLTNQPVSWTGVYIENCMDVIFGYFGNLEVFSHMAFDTLAKNVDFCQGKIDWAKPDATKWGPIGEDLFAQKCMDMKGVTKLQNFELSTDGACPYIRKIFGEKENKKFKPPCDKVWTPAIHPYKKPAEWAACRAATAAR